MAAKIPPKGAAVAALVIRGKLDLKIAQHEIATDWIAAYKKYVGPTPTSGRRLSCNAEALRESGSPKKSG
jgi:hypothetical protein